MSRALAVACMLCGCWSGSTTPPPAPVAPQRTQEPKVAVEQPVAQAAPPDAAPAPVPPPPPAPILDWRATKHTTRSSWTDKDLDPPAGSTTSPPPKGFSELRDHFDETAPNDYVLESWLRSRNWTTTGSRPPIVRCTNVLLGTDVIVTCTSDVRVSRQSQSVGTTCGASRAVAASRDLFAHPACVPVYQLVEAIARHAVRWTIDDANHVVLAEERFALRATNERNGGCCAGSPCSSYRCPGIP